MSDPTNQTITQYLLGILPEAETERLDELSVTNAEFAESLSATEKDLIDAYVQGELSRATLAQFESHYLTSPLRRERVEFAEAFQVFAAKQTALDSSAIRGEVNLDPKRKEGWLSTLSIFGGRHPALQWGLAAAAVVFIVAGAFLLAQNVRLRQQMSLEQAGRDELQQREQELQKQLEQQRTTNTTIEQQLAQVREERARLEEELKKSGKPPTVETAIASFVLAPQLRGAGQIKTITIPAGTEHVGMRLELEPNDYSNYTVALIDRSSHQTLWRSGRVKSSGAAENKLLSVSFSASLLRLQTYSLQVSGISSTGAAEPMSDYPFKVVK